MDTKMRTVCRCGIDNWSAARQALGLTQEGLGRLIGLSKRQVIRLEGEDHACPHEAVVILLHAWMQDPLARERLKAAGFPLEEKPAAAMPGVEAMRLANPEGWRMLVLGRPRTQICEADGIPIAFHPHCKNCGILLGDEHDDPLTPDKLCASCQEQKELYGAGLGQLVELLNETA